MSPTGTKDGMESGRWQVRGGVPARNPGADSTFSAELPGSGIFKATVIIFSRKTQQNPPRSVLLSPFFNLIFY